MVLLYANRTLREKHLPGDIRIAATEFAILPPSATMKQGDSAP